MSADRRRVTPEQATFAASAAILLALAVAIVALWVQQRDPVTLSVEQVGEVRVAGRQSYLTAEVRNTGDETAEAVEVIAELVVDGDLLAEGTQSIDFLSGGDIETIVFIFDQSSPDAAAALRVASYQVP